MYLISLVLMSRCCRDLELSQPFQSSLNTRAERAPYYDFTYLQTHVAVNPCEVSNYGFKQDDPARFILPLVQSR